MVSRSLNPLLDILARVRWRVVDQELDVLADDDYIEVVPQDRARAWSELFILALRQTPFTYRTNLRKANLEHFDYNQPIYYSLKHHQLALVSDDLIKSLQPPIYSAMNNEIINPFAVMIVFILLLLSCVAWEGFDKKQRD
ncbi:pif-6 [Spodoptera frugiperda granulovirus]|uniref:Pif-6 n=1 Tax=Spodoptera frugiperda granulovirus TaxID=307454 RepID=A0A0C5ASH0_9BBAC|nr:pif-6 [Spodoptera frugiperda granulovirus]AJK91772.1 pif-6 [Spodoptera frugiperda granulovirus]AXS01135.1 pif-6 [Spodoptera frugiperda granulovirus]